MASDPPSRQEGLSQHPFVEKLMPDPAQPAAPTVQYEGLVGKSTREGEDYWRLYFDRDLTDYIEFNKDDVLNSESIAKEWSAMGLESTKVWLKRDATITRTHSRQVRADAAESAPGRYANPSAAGVVPGSLGNPYGGGIPPGAGLQGRVVPNLNRLTLSDYSDIRIGTGGITGSRELAPGVTAKKPPPPPKKYVAGDHFYTTSESERSNAMYDFGYDSEGTACAVHVSQVAGTVKLYRLAGPKTPCGDHFYTTSRTEAESAVYDLGYVSEGVACYVFSYRAPNTVPFYRMLNRANGDHFYTTSETEADNAILSLGYRDEGVACYVYEFQAPLPPDAAPFYRLLRTKDW